MKRNTFMGFIIHLLEHKEYGTLANLWHSFEIIQFFLDRGKEKNELVFTFLAHYKRPDLSSCCDAASKARVSGLLFSPFVDRLPLVMKKRMICMTHPFLVFPHYFSPLSDLIRMLRSKTLACVTQQMYFFFVFNFSHCFFVCLFFLAKTFFFSCSDLATITSSSSSLFVFSEFRHFSRIPTE